MKQWLGLGLGNAGSLPYAPETDTNVAVFFDAAAGVTASPTVSTWGGRKGGVALVQATPSQQPSLALSVNGQACPTGVRDPLGVSNSSLVTNSTTEFVRLHSGDSALVVGIRLPSSFPAYGNRFICYSGANVAAARGATLYFPTSSSGVLRWRVSNGSALVVDSDSAAQTAGGVVVVSMMLSSSTYTWRINGVAVASGAVAAAPSSAASFTPWAACGIGPTGNAAECGIRAIAVCNSTAFADAERYVSALCGV